MATTKQNSYDAIIVGAGPGGVMCALSCARAGLRALLVEANPEATFGHTCVTEVERSAFEEVDVPEPKGEEVAFTQKGVRVLSPRGKHAFSFEGHPMHAVKLDWLVRRLLGYARDEGVETLFGTTVQAPVLDGERVIGVDVRDGGGNSRRIEAKITVDATGYNASLIRRMPPECGIDFSDRDSDCVLAEARLYDIDRTEAEIAVADGLLKPDYFHHQIGVQGSFSTLSYLVSLEKEHAFVLTGVKADNAPPGPEEQVAHLEKRFPLFKTVTYRGTKPIRLRRASLRLVCDGFAAVGEAAGMVIPAHGSGVASGLLSGHNLGLHLGALVRADKDMSTANLWPWCARYQRNRGAILASYDANRRLVETLDPEREINVLVESGVMQPEDMQRTLVCKSLNVDPASIPRRLPGILRHPLIAGSFIAQLPKVMKVEKHWRKYPLEWNHEAFSAWKKTAEKLLP